MLRYHLAVTPAQSLIGYQDDDALTFVDSAEEVEGIKKHFAGSKPWHKHKLDHIDAFFIEALDGEYGRVIAIENTYGYIGDLRNQCYIVDGGLR